MRWMQFVMDVSQESKKVICGNCFLERQIGSKQRDAGFGSFDLTEKPCQAFPFLLVNIVGDIHRNCIIQYGSCFMKRQMGKAKGKASQSVLRAPQNVIHFQEARNLCLHMETVQNRHIWPFQGG